MLLEYRIASSGFKNLRRDLAWRHGYRHLVDISVRTITSVKRLDSWDIELFREQAFLPQLPVTFPHSHTTTVPAFSKWFIHDPDLGPGLSKNHSTISELNPSFWEMYAQCQVPLEITTYSAQSPREASFVRVDAPLQLLLKYLDAGKFDNVGSYSIYLAQHDLRDLPQSLQNDLPTPSLVKNAGKGDLYSSSLWLGRPPTYTPLHRDPNPNLFVQLTGTKVIRLLEPRIGDAVFAHCKRLLRDQQLQSTTISDTDAVAAAFRGEEMMQGPERTILHDAVWGASSEMNNNTKIMPHLQEATLQLGQAIFIPRGWWHSIKGIGEGVITSANWWFR